MPSPVGHTLFTLSVLRLSGKEIFKNKFLLLLGLFLGLSPDIDLALIIIFGFKEGGKYHQLYTHSIFFVIMIFLFLFVFTRGFKLSFLLSSLVLFHIIIDIFSVDLKPPIGVPIFSPLSSLTLNIGILPKIEKSSFSSLFSKNNLQAMLIEIAIFLPILLIVYFLTAKRNDGRKGKKHFHWLPNQHF